MVKRVPHAWQISETDMLRSNDFEKVKYDPIMSNILHSRTASHCAVKEELY